MAGKAPSRRKDKTRNSRPYDRPNQGLFGRVASKVKDLLTPSWIFSVPNWIRTEEVDGTILTTQIDEDLTENEEESTQVKSTSKPRLPIRPTKRLRYDNNVAHVTIEESPSLPWPGPSTSRERTVVELEDREITPIIPNCDIRKKDSQVIVNGDDHSENSDNSASTSGCSSLISSQDKPHRSSSLKLSESALKHLRGELKRKSTFSSPRQDVTLPADMFSSSSISRLNENRTTLWSCGTQTPVKSFPQRPSPSNRPSFNVSSFGRTTMMNPTPNMKISSPFYEGNTTYGGASAYRKKSLAPYQINSAKSLRNQVKVKENTSNEGIECMSSAARRILHTLERMSTPISDAKRMPNLTQSPLDISSTIAPPSHRLKSYLPVSSTSTASPKGPPIVNLNALSKVPLLKNRNSRITRNSMMEIPIQPCSPSILEDCLTKPVKDAQDISSNQSPGGGGKMKTKRHSLHPSRTKDVEESSTDYNLPNVPLPIQKMPVFKLSSSVAESSSAKRKVTESENQPESKEPLFTFSNPIEYSMPPATSQSPKVTSSFEFSPPLVVTPEAKPVQKTATESQNNSGLILSGSVNDILKNMRDCKKSTNFSQEKSTAKNNNAVASTSTGGFGDKFKPKPGSWICDTCLLQNVDCVKCIACETPRQTPTEVKTVDKFSTSSGFGDKFKPKPGSWTCGSCLLQNDGVKCIACETPRQTATEAKTVDKFSTTSGFGDKFKPQAGVWKCPICMIGNVHSDEKCVACGAFNPSQKDKPSGKDWPKVSDSKTSGISSAGGKLFQNNTDTWECDTCLVRNASSSTKCAACETSKPSKLRKDGQEAADSKMSSIFSTGGKLFQNNADTWACDTCLVRNPSSITKCAACETLKPSKGKSSTNANFGFKFGASTQNSSSPFTFGSLVSTSVPTSVTSSPKFGVPASTSKPTTDVSETSKFGVPLQSSKTTVSESGFKFGVLPETSKITVSESGFKFGVPLQMTEVSAKPTVIFGSQDPDKTTSNSSSAKGELAQDSMKTAGGFKFGVQPISEEKVTSVSPTTGHFNVNKPMVFANSSTDSSGFKHLDSATTGFKFGATPLGTFDATKTKPEDSKQTRSSTSVAPASIFGSNAPTSSHSTTDTENRETPSSTLASAISEPPSTVLSTLKPIAPFAFGTPTTTVASSVSLSGNSNVSTFGQFGENTSKSREPSPFEMIGKKTSMMSAPLLSQNTKTIASSGITPFNFNPPTFTAFAAPKTQAETKSISLLTTVSTIASSMPVFTNIASTPSTFVFGGQNATTTAATTSIFTFGAAAPATSSSLTPVPSTNTSKFEFGATSMAESKSGFGVKLNEEKKPSLFAPPSVPVFGTSNPPAVSMPFKFGDTTSQPAIGGFGFSTPKQDVPSTQGKFAFGAGEAAKPSFTAFPSSQPTTMASTMQSFNFGSNPPNSSAFKPATPKFTFGAKTISSAPASNPLNPPANPPSVFGSPATQLPVFGANTSSPAFGSTVAPAFGNISAVPKLQEPATGGFNFSATSVPTAASTPFMFGAPVEKKSAMGTAQAPGFNFMAPQPPRTDQPNSNFSADFSMSTPPNFNFGATSTLTNQPFQFAAEGSSNPNAAVTGARRIRKAVRRVNRKD